MKKILYITKYFPPYVTAASFRALKISNGLINFGFQPIILTSDSNPNKKDNNLLKEIAEEVILFKFNMDKYLGYPSFIKNLLKIRKQDFSLIYATGPPFSTFFYAFILKILKRKIPLILEYRDPWINNPYHSRNKFFSIFHKLLERILLKMADKIIFISEALQDWVLSIHSKIKIREKCSVVQNALEPPKKESKELLKDENDNKDSTNQLRLVLTSSLYGARNPIPFFKIILKLKKRGIINKDNFKFELYGSYNEKFDDFIKKNELSDLVIFYGPQNHQVCLEAQRKSTLLVDISEKDIDYPTFPYHFWEYFATGKKILYLGKESSYKSDYLVKNNRGIVLPLDNEEKMESEFLNVLDHFHNDSDLSYFKVDLSKDFINKNIWNDRIKKIVNLIEEIQ